MELPEQAENGQSAYELYIKLKPDVVITDIRMEGMNGFTLIQKIREIDQECAIVVISCLDDFETLRKMIPYNITGYILKASMDREEVFEVLEKARKHLESIGRVGAKEQEKSGILDDENFKQILLFFLDEESQKKINGLAIKFLSDLVKRQIPAGFMIETEKNGFCLLLSKQYKDINDRIRRINLSVDSFLGVQFHTMLGERKENESWKDCYHRLQQDKMEERIEEQCYDAFIQKAIRHMREHHKENLYLKEIAKIAGVSPSYFSHLFKKETGKNYVEFLNEIRMEKVLSELRISDHKILVVAENNGFRNLEHFSRLFKKCMGVSPAKWREQNR